MKLKSLELEHQYEGPSSWWQHVPVAHSLIELTKPNLVVELGSHYGVSFFSFCEAAEKYSRDSLIYAIDTWEGDKQAGFYGDDVYRKVRAHAELNHIQRARLIRCRFEEAVEQFKDKSIDLLHIDGLHTYEAVKNDYKTWLPKLKECGTILFHDWNVKKEGFGVWKLWEEIKDNDNFKCIEMENGYGLGIATKTKHEPEWHRTIIENKEALKCKGNLLAELNRKSEFTEEIIREKELMEKHIFNLEVMVNDKQTNRCGNRSVKKR